MNGLAGALVRFRREQDSEQDNEQDSEQDNEQDNEQDFSAQAIETLRRSFYVDDMLKSVNTVTKATCHVKEMT